MKLKKQFMNFLKKHKFLVLAIVALPLAALFVWSMRSSNSKGDERQQQVRKGYNMSLPGAQLKEDGAVDKMSYYNKAALDSAKRKELMKNDPYYSQQETQPNEETFDRVIYPQIRLSKNKTDRILNSDRQYTETDSNEVKVYRKINQLNKVLNNSSVNSKPRVTGYPNYPNPANALLKSTEVDRLDKMMKSMSQKDGEDPEMKQLNGMLDKIRDIQHPELIQEKIRQTSETRKGQVFAVSAQAEPDPVSLVANTIEGNGKQVYHLPSHSNNFYTLEDSDGFNNEQNSIEAVIHETQTLVNGSVVKLRLVNDVYINGILVPKDNFLYGITSINDERLTVKINSIRYRNKLFPVMLSVYDMDGLEGIYVPGAITRDVAKQSADRALQSIGITTLDPSLGAQAASAGIEAAKSLASKKAKLVKVTVKAGYQVLLNDEKQKQNN